MYISPENKFSGAFCFMQTKILIIRFSSIGDVVLTTPVIRCLKKQVKNAEIHFVTKEKHASIVRSNPYIAKVHVLGNDLGQLIAGLKEEKFSYIVDLHQNFRSNRIKRSLHVPSCTYEKLNVQKFLLVRFKINRLPAQHVVDRYMKAVAGLNVKNDGQGLDFFIPEDDAFNNDKLPEAFQHGYVAFVIAGTYTTKKLPAGRVLEICNRIDVPVILLGGKNEFGAGNEIQEKSKGNVMNFAGKISLNQSASVIQQANVVLTNDTGLMHIAAAFNKKILSFWGNTVPEFGMFPYQSDPASKILEVKNLKCRPCSKLGYEKCPKSHFKCMNELNVEEAVQWIKTNY